MKKEFFKLIFISALAISCSLSVNDSNPTPALVSSAGIFGEGLSGSILTITGSALNNVTSVALTPNNSPTIKLGPITSRTATALKVALPAALVLPGMLLISTANATETYPLASLTNLTVEGTLNASADVNVTGNATISGTANIGRERPQHACGVTAGLCTVSCTTGNVIVGGGCQVSPSTVGISSSYPSGPGDWTCQSTASASVTAWAICARMDGQ